MCVQSWGSFCNKKTDKVTSNSLLCHRQKCVTNPTKQRDAGCNCLHSINSLFQAVCAARLSPACRASWRGSQQLCWAIRQTIYGCGFKQGYKLYITFPGSQPGFLHQCHLLFEQNTLQPLFWLWCFTPNCGNLLGPLETCLNRPSWIVFIVLRRFLQFLMSLLRFRRRFDAVAP